MLTDLTTVDNRHSLVSPCELFGTRGRWLADDTQPIAVERAVKLSRVCVSKNLVDGGRGGRTLVRAGQNIFLD